MSLNPQAPGAQRKLGFTCLSVNKHLNRKGTHGIEDLRARYANAEKQLSVETDRRLGKESEEIKQRAFDGHGVVEMLRKNAAFLKVSKAT